MQLSINHTFQRVLASTISYLCGTVPNILTKSKTTRSLSSTIIVGKLSDQIEMICFQYSHDAFDLASYLFFKCLSFQSFHYFYCLNVFASFSHLPFLVMLYRLIFTSSGLCPVGRNWLHKSLNGSLRILRWRLFGPIALFSFNLLCSPVISINVNFEMEHVPRNAM